MSQDRAAIVADYASKWEAMVVTRPAAVDVAAKKIVANAEYYKAVQAQTGVPWYFVGVLHMRECDNNLKGCLANGELIVGTNRKTRLVPKGRGPYATFIDSAIDALDLQGFAKVTDWSPPVCCYEGERFNGMGYRNKGKPSPYVLGATQFYQRGKYIRDGVYSDSVVDPQLGIMPVMKRAMELAAIDVPEVPKPSVIMTAVSSRTVRASAMGIGAIFATLQDWWNSLTHTVLPPADFIPGAVQDTQTSIDTTRQVASWFHVNAEHIVMWVAVVTLAYVIIRRIIDKREQPQ